MLTPLTTRPINQYHLETSKRRSTILQMRRKPNTPKKAVEIMPRRIKVLFRN